jgi:putative transposase
VRRKYPWGFYVHGPKESRIKSTKKAYNKAKYITRYVRHPPISDSRIVSCQNDEVKFWYEKPSTDKRYYVTLPVLEFIHRVVMHLPKKGTHMVVSYGLYSPRYVGRPVVQQILSPSGKVVDPKDLSWREQMILQNGKDPLACPHCGVEMVEVCMVVKRRDKLRVKFRLFVEDIDAIGYPDEQGYVGGVS